MVSAYLRNLVWPQSFGVRRLHDPFDTMSLLDARMLAELDDTETSAHMQRVRFYSNALALELATKGRYRDIMDDAFLDLIGPASLLHDIGKSAIPREILRKPGALTPQEFEIMKTHTTAGVRMLESAQTRFWDPELLEMARSIALHHHEKFDGSGYPVGLKGEEIPLAARIVALADVYDALTSKRVYKAAYSHGVARGIIVGQSGRHFDPAIVAAFVSIERTFERTYLQFADNYAKAG